MPSTPFRRRDAEAFDGAKGVSQIELHAETGIAKSTISEIFAGKKRFSRKIIRTLADFFDVEVTLLAANI